MLFSDFNEMHKQFEILLRQKIPLLTKGTAIILVLCFIILVLFGFWMLPSDPNSSTEMRTAYFILVVPDWQKYLAAGTFLALLIFLPLNMLRRRQRAMLYVFNDRLLIKNEHYENLIQFEKIRRLYVNDLTNLDEELKNKLQIGISYDYDKNISFFLKSYGDYDELIESLKEIDPGKFSFYNKSFLPDP